MLEYEAIMIFCGFPIGVRELPTLAHVASARRYGRRGRFFFQTYFHNHRCQHNACSISNCYLTEPQENCLPLVNKALSTAATAQNRNKTA